MGEKREGISTLRQYPGQEPTLGLGSQKNICSMPLAQPSAVGKPTFRHKTHELWDSLEGKINTRSCVYLGCSKAGFTRSPYLLRPQSLLDRLGSNLLTLSTTLTLGVWGLRASVSGVHWFVGLEGGNCSA